MKACQAILRLMDANCNDRLSFHRRPAFLAMSGIERSRRPLLFLLSRAFFFMDLDVKFHVRIKGQNILWADPL